MKSNSIKIHSIIILIILLCSTSIYPNEFSVSDKFERANKFYQDKDYQSAIILYQSILQEDVESSAIYFNLGNSYFKNGDLGHAILNYMRAKRISPGDEDIRQNLEFARQFSRVKMEGVRLNPISSLMLSLVDKYNLNSLAWVSSIFFILLVIILIIKFGLGFNYVWLKSGIIICLILIVISFGFTTLKYRHDYITRWAVVIAEESPVYTGSSDQSDIEMDAAPGLVVEILSESSDYYDVLFENKRRGWIKKDLLAEI
jgi:tetratricopeptide (TPR) repeat protein